MDMKFKQYYTLSEPSGSYIVGCQRFVYTYDDGEEDRVIPCLCFYPASDIGDSNIKPYINDQLLPGAGSILTNSYIDAPTADGIYPVILYNHAFSLGLEANTIQCEELASHGYIVLSIGHPGDGSYELPDGEILMFDMDKMMADYYDEAAIGGEKFAEYADWLRGKGKDATMQQHLMTYESIIEVQPNMVANTALWIQDSLVALDKFLTDTDLIIYDHIDVDNVGTLGMSYGGAVAMSLTFSEVIKACANLDGFYYAEEWDEPITKPLLLMHHDGLGGLFLTFPFLNAEDDAYLVTIKDTIHGNFTDYNEILAENFMSKGEIAGQEVEVGMLGDVDPDRMEQLMNMMLVDFFDKYLKGKASQVIDQNHLPDDVTLLRK